MKLIKSFIFLIGLIVIAGVLYFTGAFAYLMDKVKSFNMERKATVTSASGDPRSVEQESAVVKAPERVVNCQMRVAGKVIKVLPDDLQGSKHQRFIVRITTGQTILVTHNIDIAKKIPNLKVGDIVDLYGEYVWNPKGGIIHWTHHDPSRQHEDGWVLHHGKKYH